ncbi:MAG TPA: glycosyltransferase family 39 protein [Vicinamibacterales bacterium]|nr:glycosyltransferase family 39 protein [Vicinamibacterales bacterium]
MSTQIDPAELVSPGKPIRPVVRHGTPTWVFVRIVLGALGFRVVSAVLAFFTNVAFPPVSINQAPMFDQPSPFWDQFARYDSGWYYQIARSGYEFVTGGPSVGVGKPGKIAYFPLYPLFMRYAGRLFGRGPLDLYVGGIVVSWTAFAIAMVGVYLVARLDLSRRQAERAALLTAIFPFSFFFGMVYTEALFLALTVFTFYGFRTRRWALGAVCGALTTATRFNGVLMVPALAWIAWRTAEPTMRDRVRAAVALIAVLGGIGAYSWYVYRLSGNPFEWEVSITRWGYHPGGAPWLAPVNLLMRLFTHPYQYLASDRMALYDTLYGVTGVLFAAAIPFVWIRFGAAYGLFMLLNLYVPLSSGVFEGLGRYCSVLFPCFIWLASIKSRTITTAIVVLFALFYTLGLALFTTIHPIF